MYRELHGRAVLSLVEVDNRASLPGPLRMAGQAADPRVRQHLRQILRQNEHDLSIVSEDLTVQKRLVDLKTRKIIKINENTPVTTSK